MEAHLLVTVVDCMNGLNPSPLLVSMPFVPWLCRSSRKAILFPYALNLVSDAWLSLASRKGWNWQTCQYHTSAPAFLLVISYFCHCHNKNMPGLSVDLRKRMRDTWSKASSPQTSLNWTDRTRYQREPSQDEVNPEDAGEKVPASWMPWDVMLVCYATISW